MKLFINGEEKDVQTDMTLQQLLDNLGYNIRSVAVAINGQFVSKQAYATTALSPLEKLDIVSPMQGG